MFVSMVDVRHLSAASIAPDDTSKGPTLTTRCMSAYTSLISDSLEHESMRNCDCVSVCDGESCASGAWNDTTDKLRLAWRNGGGHNINKLQDHDEWTTREDEARNATGRENDATAAQKQEAPTQDELAAHIDNRYGASTAAKSQT